MKIKTYRSPSVPQALEQIRKELGPGAVILSTRRRIKRRFFGLLPSLAYEITASAEEPSRRDRAVESYEPAPADSALGRLGPNAPFPDFARPQPRAFGPLDRFQGQLAELLQEVADLKRQLSAPVPLSELSFLRRRVLEEEFQRLIREGLEERLALSLLRAAGRGSRELTLEQLRARLHRQITGLIRTSPMGEESQAAVFLGPTGVGKTTTIAKLAAMFALAEQRRVQLITLDTYRIAAAEQLKTYGEIIGVPVEVVFSLEELQGALEESRDRDRILIDTTGHSQRQVGQFAELAEFLRSRPQIEKHLVLSATTRPAELQDMVQKFDCFGIDKLLFTKLDEALSHGLILNQLIHTGKPLSYLTNGQQVPDDLVVPTPQSVANLLVHHQSKQEEAV